MVNIKDLARLLEIGLNNKAKELGSNLAFSIESNMNRYKKTELKDTTIYGVQTLAPGSITPLAGVDNYLINTQLGMIVSISQANEVKGILNSYIEENVGEITQIDDYIAVVSFDLLSEGGYDIRANIGESITLSTNIYYQFIRNGVLSNECKLRINGELMPVLKMALPRVMTVQTDQVLGESELQSAVGQQGLTISLDVPYKKIPIITKIMNDTVLGGLNNVYKLEYTDGVVNGGEPVVWYCLIKDSAPSYQAGKVPCLSLTFLIANSGSYNEEMGDLISEV